jgi:hypothetical protein
MEPQDLHLLEPVNCRRVVMNIPFQKCDGQSTLSLTIGNVQFRQRATQSTASRDTRPNASGAASAWRNVPSRIRIPDAWRKSRRDMDGPDIAARLAAVRTVFKIEAK